MNRNQRIKILAIAAQVAQDTNGGGKRLSDVRTAFAALCEMIEPPAPDYDIRSKPQASILINVVITDPRIRNLCKVNGVKTLGDLATKESESVRRWRSCGETSYKELHKVLMCNGLSFGMVDGAVKLPTFRAGQWVRYKVGKSLWALDGIWEIKGDGVTLNGKGDMLLFRDYGRLWEVMP